MEVNILLRSWWSYLIRGILALVFGILFVSYPGATLKTFITIVGIFFLVDGLVNMIRSIVLIFGEGPWGWTMVWGILGLLLGAVLIRHTEFSLGVAAVFVGIWAVLVGIAEIAAAIDMPPMTGRGLLAVFGVISLIFGIVMLVWTAETVYAFMVLVGIYLFAAAIMDFIISGYVLFLQRKEKKGEEAEAA